MGLFSLRMFAICAALSAVAGCTLPQQRTQEPVLPAVTATRSTLFELPPPERKLDVAIYGFEDLTGQFKPSEGFQSLSKAVSQGGGPVLVKALRDTGDGSWFRVVERDNLNNLLQERRIIQEMRQLYLGEETVNPQALPPMLFAGVIIEGGVVGFDSNTVTGGAGAALLGIGARTEYRQDTISVNLRTVSVKTGEVLASVVVQKSIISTAISASSFRYVDVDKILELEAGVTTNEPGLVALTRTIEKAIYALIMEMAKRDFWKFKNPTVGRALLKDYLQEDGRAPEAQSAQAQGRGAPPPQVARDVASTARGMIPTQTVAKDRPYTG